MTTAIITAASMDELVDLRIWLESHCDETEDGPGAGSAAAIARFAEIENSADADAFPISFVISGDAVAAAQWTIDDWSEVLGSHDEEFHTTLNLKA